MIFGQVMTIFKVNPDPHFGFLCEHGARARVSFPYKKAEYIFQNYQPELITVLQKLF